MTCRPLADGRQANGLIDGTQMAHGRRATLPGMGLIWSHRCRRVKNINYKTLITQNYILEGLLYHCVVSNCCVGQWQEE